MSRARAMALRDRDTGPARRPGESRALALPILLTVVGIGAAIVGGIATYWLLSPPRRHGDPGDAGPDGPPQPGAADGGPGSEAPP